MKVGIVQSYKPNFRACSLELKNKNGIFSKWRRQAIAEYLPMEYAQYLVIKANEFCKQHGKEISGDTCLQIIPTRTNNTVMCIGLIRKLDKPEDFEWVSYQEVCAKKDDKPVGYNEFTKNIDEAFGKVAEDAIPSYKKLNNRTREQQKQMTLEWIETYLGIK